MSCTSLKRTALALEDLEPALWGTLTPCLLDLVFLRLPVAQMSQLRLLSKLWKAAFDSVESDFNLLLEDEVYPNLFGLIGWKSGSGVAYLWMFDVNQDRWCVREIDRSVGGKFIIGAADGGLVCFVSNTEKDFLTIVVMNPLTGKKVELPRLLGTDHWLPTSHTSMLHLKMNRKNNHYLVFYVGCRQSGNKGFLAQVYDSHTKEWSIVGSREKSWGCISGHLYDWRNDGDSDRDSDDDCDDRKRRGPGLYDFAQKQLRTAAIYDVAIAKVNEYGLYALRYAMFGDRVFILHPLDREVPSNLIQEFPTFKFIISEYHLRRNATAWVEGGTHGCVPFDVHRDDVHYFYFEACSGYLMVMAHKFGPSGPYLHVWLYDLSTCNWHVLPDIPGYHDYSNYENVSMCELRWSAAP